MKKNKGIVIALIVFLLLIVTIFFIFNKNSKPEEIVVEEKSFDCDSLNYSRVSFFNITKDRVSLNIPESWEGNYRLREDGNKAVFYYLRSDGSASEMFAISRKRGSGDIDKIVCKKEDLNFLLDVSSLEMGEFGSDILNEFQCIKESIKCN